MAIAEHEGIESELIPRIATGLCGGMGRTSGLCGALTGGILALNMLYGRNTTEESRDKNYAMVGRFIGEFEKQLGSGNCTELLGCDLSTDEGYETFKDRDLIKTCAGFTEKATAMVMALIEEDRNKE